jgi:membrane-bound lytic murein transglycosylase D
MTNTFSFNGIKKALCIGLLAFLWLGLNQAYAQVVPEEEEEEYLLIDTISGEQLEAVEYDEEDGPEDSLQYETEEAIDSLQDLGMGNYIPKVPMELLYDRLACIEGDMPLYLNKRVASFIDYFVVRNRNYTQTMLERKHIYFPLFEKYLAQYGLPDELKYLSIVESGLHYGAISKSGAVGLWQFMVPTGKDMGLKVDYYIDERLDPEKSTIAACKYLKMLYRVFGDWELVLAAYNCGLGKIQATKRKTGKQHFWDMYDALPQETRAYVPQFVALTYATNFAFLHNIYPDSDSMLIVPASDTIQVYGSTDLEKLALALDIPFAKLKILNPTLRRYKTPHNSAYTLNIPADYKEEYVARRSEISPLITISDRDATLAMADYDRQKSTRKKSSHSQQNWVRIKVKRGESLFAIANKYGVSAKEIKGWNNLRTTKVRSGQSLKIASSEKLIAKATTKTESKNSPSENAVTSGKSQKANNTIVHEVRPGDTLWRISQQYKDKGVTVEDIIRLNDLKDRKIVAGQKLIVG